MVLVEQMIVFFIIMGIGFWCGKKGFINDDNAKNLSWIVVNIATPAMILSAGMNTESSIKGKSLVFGFLVAIAVYAFNIAISFLIIPLLRVPKEDVSIYRVMTIFSNVGFMGLPILQAAYGSEAVLYGAIFQFPYNFLMYTYGIAAIRGDKPDREGFNLGKILNVGVISCVIAIALYISGLRMPGFITSSAWYLGNLAAPLSMMVIGQSLVRISVKDLLGDARLLGFSLIKLIPLPFIGMLFVKLFIQDQLILNVCYIMLAAPIGSMTAMVAQQYGGNYSLASRGVALSTILSVVTIPLGSFLIKILNL